jgi:plasmid stabilization system protein ParE
VIGVRYHAAAEDEIQEAVDYYDARRRSLGDRFLKEVRSTVRRLREYPRLGSPVEGEVRRFVLRRFPYSIYYQVHPRELHVLSVVHHSRESPLWQGRL